ncbi:MAG TPA: saccharopine dehydrogenase NADP-binding domain-containing protein [Chloroflexia bacterium]|nr:saccharopine dehydrogenase NADP-binding domain-containing protein [Chloroflexia bacterium]
MTGSADTKRSRILVMGATGYTGRQVVTELQRLGLPCALAGRDRARLTSLKTELKLPEDTPLTVADPTQPASLSALFTSEIGVIINCAGPFTTLGEAVVRASIEASVPYLDITGEQGYIARIIDKYDNPAQQKGCAVVPACGFEYAMTNWASALAAEDLGEIAELWTATAVRDLKTSRGTQLSALAAISQPGYGWQSGRRVPKIAASSARQVDFPAPFGKKNTIWVPFGEMLTIPRYIAVENLQSFMATPGFSGRILRIISPLLPALSQIGGVVLKPLMRGPQAEYSEKSRWAVLAEARNKQGQVKRVTLQGQNVYGLTVVLIVWCAQQMLATNFSGKGVLGPAQAFDPHAALDYLKDFGLTTFVKSLEE